MISSWQEVTGIVKRGHQVASGMAKNSPYPRGTIEMQLPLFRALGLDLSSLFLGTLNVSIAPFSFTVENPEYTFNLVKWNSEYPPETFSFSRCEISFNNITNPAYIYYPHPETKIGHFQDDSILEVIAPKIIGIKYGDRVNLKIKPQAIKIDRSF
ncbi:MAG: hypothetical protein ACFBSE_24465 [Prochloraceae cyanobacterium]